MFLKIGVLKNFSIFAGKHLCWSLFLIKKRLQHRCFPANIAKFLRTSFFYGTPLVAATPLFLVNVPFLPPPPPRPKDIRKPKVFRCFQEIWEGSISLWQLNVNLQLPTWKSLYPLKEILNMALRRATKSGLGKLCAWCRLFSHVYYAFQSN